MEKCNKMDIEDTPKRVGKIKIIQILFQWMKKKKLLNQKN